jgi:ketosteroid isomerase-like protein
MVNLLLTLMWLATDSHAAFSRALSDFLPQIETISTAKATASAEYQTGLTVTLASDKDTYLLGEPITLTLEIENRTSSTLFVHKAFEVEYGRIWVYLINKDGTSSPYRGPYFGIKDTVFPLVPYQPGERSRVSFTVLCHFASRTPEDPQRFYFLDKEGKHLLRAELIGIMPNQRVVSEPIEIELVLPQGEDRLVWKMLQTKDAAFFLHTGRPLGNSSILEFFQEIIRNFPRSTYVPHIRTSIEKLRGLQTKSIQAASTTQPLIYKIVFIGSQPIMVGSRADLSNTHRNKTAADIINLINGWVEAYNRADVDGFVDHLSPKNTIRREWDQAPGDRDRESIVNRYTNALGSTGSLSMEVVRINLQNNMATAEVLVSVELEPERKRHHEIRFAQEDDGDWKILDSDL